jgi:hypothetical protein
VHCIVSIGCLGSWLLAREREERTVHCIIGRTAQGASQEGGSLSLQCVDGIHGGIVRVATPTRYGIGSYVGQDCKHINIVIPITSSNAKSCPKPRKSPVQRSNPVPLLCHLHAVQTELAGCRLWCRPPLG